MPKLKQQQQQQQQQLRLVSDFAMSLLEYYVEGCVNIICGSDSYQPPGVW
jgi:hypothetical protein